MTNILALLLIQRENLYFHILPIPDLGWHRKFEMLLFALGFEPWSLDAYMWYFPNLKKTNLTLFVIQEIPWNLTSWGFDGLLKHFYASVTGEWIIIHIYNYLWDIISYPCPNFNSSLTRPLLALWRGGMITAHKYMKCTFLDLNWCFMLFTTRSTSADEGKLLQNLVLNSIWTRGLSAYIARSLLELWQIL